MSSADLPGSCLRGIRRQEWLYRSDEGVHVHQVAFMPEESAMPAADERGWLETSVNWEDDDGAVSFTRAQRTDKGHSLNAHGVARLATTAVHGWIQAAPIRDTLSCERRPLPDNRYHGNLLFHSSLPKPMLRMLAGALALKSRLVPDGGDMSAAVDP
jgi:hypothetical protein